MFNSVRNTSLFTVVQFNPTIPSVYTDGQTHVKNLSANTAEFLACV